jgi:alpha-mannosidase
LELREVWSWVNGGAAPSARRDEIYEILLINQFHDILPGTSIPEVHDRAISEVSDIIREAQEMTAALLAKAVVAKPETIMVWNTLSWTRTGTIAVNHIADGLIPEQAWLSNQRIEDIAGRKSLLIGGVELPALGAQVIELKQEFGSAVGKPSPFLMADNRLETPYASVLFDEYGYIASFVDKSSTRELRGNGYPLNAFLMGEDLPGAWDNWDIDRDVFGKLKLQNKLICRDVVADGELQFRIRSQYHIGLNSALKQDIVFHANSPQVDFETIIDWQEKHQLLKVGFDVNILAHSARHEIQFGHVERPTHTNTTYDQSMFEVCAHKWTDISENRFGITLLNDCKYGVSVAGSDIRLSLHKGGTHPDPRGDEGIHEVTYSLLPHQGGFSAESVIRPSYELNVQPLIAYGSPDHESNSFLELGASNVILETVKPAEDDKAYVIRLYEAERSAVKGMWLRFNSTPSRVTLVNMLEEELTELPVNGSEVLLDFHPFEIKTIKVFI